MAITFQCKAWLEQLKTLRTCTRQQRSFIQQVLKNRMQKRKSILKVIITIRQYNGNRLEVVFLSFVLEKSNCGCKQDLWNVHSKVSRNPVIVDVHRLSASKLRQRAKHTNRPISASLVFFGLPITEFLVIFRFKGNSNLQPQTKVERAEWPWWERC